jgi:hypothetical protein
MTNSKQFFIALTGAKKNAGDFLITDRALKILSAHAPNFDFKLFESWLELTDLDFINSSNGIIILGGPGLRMKMYPNTYKLVTDLNLIKVPIYGLGLGWDSFPGDDISEKLYAFSSSSLELLKKMDKVTISVRDYQSQRVLANHGFKNVLMTGCPAWYNIKKIGCDFVQPEVLKKIIFTPPQNKLFSNQSISVLKYLVGRFSSSEITVSFHRGIDEIDCYTSNSEANNNLKLAAAAKKLGLNIIDLSYGSDKFSLYDDCDLHIGYRVHAHIYFLANRLPSILINEDGRGISVSEALKTPGINAFGKSKYFFQILRIKKNSLISRIYSKLSQKPNNLIVTELDKLTEKMIETNYEAFIESSRIIDETYIVMKNFINLILNYEEKI